MMNRKTNLLKLSLIMISGMVLTLSSCSKDEDKKPLEIGDFHKGGIIFYLDGQGGGMVVALEDQVSGGNTIQWYNGDYGYTDATGEDIGTGKSNTAAIISSQGDGHYAAKVCDDLVLNGFDDWFLPSNDELREINKHLYEVGRGLFENDGESIPGGIYWSSTEYNGYYAYRVLLTSSFFTPGISDKSGVSDQFGAFYVRAVREF